MTDSSFPLTHAPDKAEGPPRQRLEISQAPAPDAAPSVMLAGAAALASLALIFLIPRIGGRFARWQRAASAWRLLAAPRETVKHGR